MTAPVKQAGRQVGRQTATRQWLDGWMGDVIYHLAQAVVSSSHQPSSSESTTIVLEAAAVNYNTHVLH